MVCVTDIKKGTGNEGVQIEGMKPGSTEMYGLQKADPTM